MDPTRPVGKLRRLPPQGVYLLPLNTESQATFCRQGQEGSTVSKLGVQPLCNLGPAVRTHGNQVVPCGLIHFASFLKHQ